MLDIWYIYRMDHPVRTLDSFCSCNFGKCGMVYLLNGCRILHAAIATLHGEQLKTSQIPNFQLPQQICYPSTEVTFLWLHVFQQNIHPPFSILKHKQFMLNCVKIYSMHLLYNDLEILQPIFLCWGKIYFVNKLHGTANCLIVSE